MGAVLTMRTPVAPAQARVIQTVKVNRAAETSRSQSDWASLVQRTAAGDQQAVAEFYDATSHLVFGLALRILGDRHSAEDVVVEVYTQAWRRAKDYDPTRGTACSWLLTLARSRAIDMLRAHKHDRDIDPLESAGELEANTPNPEDASADIERHHFVRRALDGLGAEQREAIELAYFSGLSHTEIAARLGQPLGTVKTRIRLGMMRLREVLGHLATPAMALSKESM